MDYNASYYTNILKEYENIMPSIQEQLMYYKNEFEVVKKELLNLEHENKVLSMKLEDALSRSSKSEIDFERKYTELEFIDNLKSQLNLSIQEKKSMNELWKNSLHRIDSLESELKLHDACSQSNSKTVISKVKKTYEKHIKTLNNELKNAHTKLEETIKKSQESLESRKRELNKLTENQNKNIETVGVLEAEIKTLQEKQVELEDLKMQLEKSLNDKNKLIADLKIETYNAKLKVAEACHVIEIAMMEKDASVMREKEAQNEILKLTTTMNQLLEETEDKVRKEVHAIKDQYNGQIHKFRIEIKKSQEEIELKNMDLEKRTNICKQLESEIDMVRKNSAQFENLNTSERAILTRKIEDTLKKLLISERLNEQLTTEIKNMKSSVEQLNTNYETKLTTKEMEKQMLESKIKSLQNDLELSNAKLMQVAVRVDELNNRIKAMDDQIHREYEVKTAKSEKVLTERLSEIENFNQKINEELRKQLQSQIALNHKWKSEMRLITEKLENRIMELKRDVVEMRGCKADLENKLEISSNTCKQYKAHLKRLCSEFNNIADMAVNTS